ncbi:MAG: hypothetical protein JOZ32_19915 [Bryobacterales bacterium]|nr:hypothetical protein [Bryobacterales bacterium]
MSLTGCASDTELGECQSEAAKGARGERSRPLNGVLVGFAATMAVALGLASWYVGVRIVAAEEAVPPLSAARPAVVSAASSATSEGALAEAFWYTVPAPRPDFYLQVAGLGPRKDAKFVKWLHAERFHAQVNSAEEVILIGPFSGPTELEKARRKLQLAGVLAIERMK